MFSPVGEGERDMVLLQHDIGLEMPDKTEVDRDTSFLWVH